MWVLGPFLALQGCTKEEPQTTTTITATASAQLQGSDTSALSLLQTYEKAEVPIEWRTFTGTNLAQGDDTVTTVTSPFPIPFANGPGQTSVRISMNGAITFDAVTSLTFTNTALPYATRTTLVAPFWDDLYPGPTAADNVYWGVLGTAPNREFVVEWRNVHSRPTRTNTPPNTLLFQVVFFEDSPNILVNYQDVLVGNGTYDRGASATVGVQNTSTLANQHSFNTASLNNDTAILWQWLLPSEPPVVGSVATSPATLSEGDTLTVDTDFTDPDGASSSPWKVQVDTNYNGTSFSTDFSQEATEEGPVSVSGVVRTSGELTLGVRVLDKGNSTSEVVTTSITVADVPPEASAISISGEAEERIPVTLTSSFMDPGLDAPWKVQWDFDYDGTTFTVDQESTASAPGPITRVHSFANDGTFTVALRITDKDGVESAIQTLQVTVADLAPLLTGIAGNTDLMEGSPLELSSMFSDPGDNSKPWKVQWDFDYDGEFEVMEEDSYNTAGEITLSRHARDSGTLTYALRVVDNDGSISQVQVIQMNIEEAHPILSPLNAEFLAGNGNEPSVVAFDLSAYSGAENPFDDPIRAFLWDFDGDGSFDYASTSPYAYYTYRDNPNGGNTFTARVRAIDEDSYSEEEVSVIINNVAPTLIAPVDPVPVTEGTMLVLRLLATDPGADALEFSASGTPEGMILTPDGLLLWTPGFKHTNGAGKQHTIQVSVKDDDNATDSKSITLVAKWKDLDGDGMADTWEVQHGLDPTRDDSAEDANGDGVTNLAQFLSENGGKRIPSAAVAAGPASGSKVDANQVDLTTQNVVDPGDLTSVRYQFQVFADMGLATLVRDVTEDQAASATVTTVTITDGTESPSLVDLDDDHVYAWRVRATDGTVQGPWSAVQRFMFNPVNDAPDAPRAAQPLSGTQVSTDKPLLVVDNALDVDDSDLTYVFELAEDAALSTSRLTSPELSAGAKGSTAWAVTTALKPFTKYFWRVTAKDPGGATAQSEVASFTVYIGRPGNREPGIPALSAPAANGTVATLTPELVADVAVDADGDELSYLIELDTSASFTSPNRQASSSLQAGQDGKVRWQPAALVENQLYYWRARALDPYSASDWMVGSFVINAQNDAPSAPVALNPSDAIIYTRKPTLIVQNSIDPEGDAITYSFEVRSASGVATSGDAAAGANGHTSFTVGKELEPGVEYVWVARAKDASGAVSAASAEARFQVFKPQDIPQPVEDDGGCSAGAGTLGGMLPLLAMALGLLRRRRS